MTCLICKGRGFIQDQQKAYATTCEHCGGTGNDPGTLTVRQEYAKAAMQGMLSSPHFNSCDPKEFQALPKASFAIADLMLQYEAGE